MRRVRPAFEGDLTVVDPCAGRQQRVEHTRGQRDGVIVLAATTDRRWVYPSAKAGP